MKPLGLVMEAFGPFQGRQKIDFAALGDRRLFLIEGDTGSGKTTIFDGMCAALYGQTSVGRAPGHMKCLSAEADAICRLEFAFQVGSRSFRIERTPEQERPSRRGGGKTWQAHTATLYETTDGTDHVLATKLGDVSDRIREILGLSAEQFCQVVLLPQGRFEGMLKAKAQDREPVLQVLFQTDRYLAIQRCLAEDASQAESEVKETLQAREQSLLAVGCTTAEELEQRRLALGEEVTTAKAARAALAAESTRAGAELENGRDVARRLAEHGEAERAFKSLLEQEAAVNAKRLEIARAEHAFHVEAADASLAEAARQAGEATENLRGKTSLLEGARLAKLEAAHELDVQEKRGPEQEQVRAEITRLEGYEKVVAELAGLRGAVSTAQDERNRCTTQLQSADKLLAVCIEKVETARKRHAEQEQLAATVVERRKAVKAAEKAEQQGKQAEALQEKVGALAKRATATRKRTATAETRLKKARAALAKAQADWVKAQAAELARALEAGSPCPVCGSRQHPKPASKSGQRVDQDVIDRKQSAVDDAEHARDAVRGELAELESELANATGRAEALEDGSGPSAKTAARELAEMRKLLEKAESAEAALPVLAKEIAKLTADQKVGKEKCETLSESAANAVAALAAAKAKLEQRQGDVPAQHRDPDALHQALASARAKLQAMIRALEHARESAHLAGEKLAKNSEAADGARETAEKTAQQAKALGEQLDRKLAAENFASVEEYRNAKRTRQQVEALKEAVARSDKDLAAARAWYARTEQAARGLEQPDIEKLEARVDDLVAQIRAVDTKLGALDGAIASLEDARSRIADLQKDLASREGRAATLRRLANVATGAEPRNPGFHRFVLAERLDEVLLAANRRLSPMSNGRYVVQRVREEENQRVAAGLNLEVLDGHAGKTRPVDTLSGGESFLAALSLALGLADVVQQHAGGVKLDTVFVDEGFGSLDPNALELAMECLENLHQTGRLVGVISHVAEMKERIRDAQLRVTNVRGVSEARFVVA